MRARGQHQRQREQQRRDGLHDVGDAHGDAVVPAAEVADEEAERHAEREADVDDYDVTAATRKLGEADAVLAGVSAGVLSVDGTGVVTRTNRSALELLSSDPQAAAPRAAQIGSSPRTSPSNRSPTSSSVDYLYSIGQAGQAGAGDRDALVLETLMSFKRAGCSGVLTYHAAHAARLLGA